MEKFEHVLYLKGLQPVTVFGHVKGIERILRRIGTLNPTREEAECFIVELYKSGYFYSYKVNQAKTLEYYMEFIGMPVRFGRQRKPRPLLKETLNESEVTRLIMATKNVREKAIITLLAYSGLRPKELCRVRVQDIDISMNQLRVNMGKGFRDGNVYLSGKCVQILMQYLAEYPREDFLFTTLERGNPYNQMALRKLVKVLARRAGITKRVYPYLLRHAVATNMVRRGASLYDVKQHLRHAWLETTLLYVNSLSVQEGHERFIPHYC